jgi:hypothetical protein
MSLFSKIHNWLIALIVGKKPVIMNVELSLATVSHKISDTLTINENTVLKG